MVLEAQAAGLPVLVSDQGGPRENLVPGMTGVVCNAAGGVGWANAVARCLAYPEQRQAMAVSARRYGESGRWETALQPLFHCYRAVLGHTGSRPADHAA